ncbi:MAG TPA: hypothetical protein VN812_17120 [Candidatus Acidoferrales bacterium]|nr:hypothetical protein [Candidatus Acidoferrales bacterium]
MVIGVLTLVPLAFSGHTHAASSAPDTCAVCVATHHAPAARQPLLPRIAPVLHVFHVAAPCVAAPAHVFRPFKAGRAPPVLSTARLA